MTRNVCPKAAGGLSRSSLGGINLLPHGARDRRRRLGRFALKLVPLVLLGGLAVWQSALPAMREASAYTQRRLMLERRLAASGSVDRDTERFAEVLRQAQAREILLAGFDALNRLSYGSVRLLALRADSRAWVLHAAARDHAAAMQWVKHFKVLCPDWQIGVEAVHGLVPLTAEPPGTAFAVASDAAADTAIVFALHVRWPGIDAGFAGTAPLPVSTARWGETKGDR
jgi:hypothetical protein